jgi:hypothetical protein
MFPADDICRLSLDGIAALGFGRRQLPTTLNRLTKAGFLSWQRGGGGPVPNTYRLHLPPQAQP